MSYDLVIENAHYFDGTGAPGARRHLGVRAGVVAVVSAEPLTSEDVGTRLDARGRWVMPGFFDNHTHYDAELLAAPGLRESVRHGVTTVVIGSCSLSTIFSTPEDCADLFSRVEALPREHVLPTLEAQKTWTRPGAYVQAVDALALGPNVAAFCGHSDLRAHVMGLGRAVDERERPSPGEMAQMEALLGESLDAGLLGMSSMTNPWDKLDGDRFRSAKLPSTYATWREYRRLHRVLRRRERVLQSAPNITTKVNAILFVLESAGFFLRKALKTTLITAADAKSSPFLAQAVTHAVGLANLLAGANMRWQTVPMEFEVYADGMDLVVFEEFGAGEAALHLADELERNALLQDQAYRRRFRKDYDTRFSPRVWQRDFYDAEIVACPDASVVGLSFGGVGDVRGVHPVDAFLDLVVEHGTALRWRTTIANHRPKVLRQIMKHPTVQAGFADSGAHVRNMAFYNFPLHVLRMAKECAERGERWLSVERAVHRLTREQAEWYGLDCGRIREGDRADLVVVDPEGLNDDLSAYHEAPMPCFGGLSRMVRRNDAAVPATVIGGRVVWQDGAFAEGFGETFRSGRFLRAR